MRCPGNRPRVSRGAAAVVGFVLFCCSSGIARRGEPRIQKAGSPARPTILAAGRPSEPGPLNLLSGGRSVESLRQALVPAADWHPYPRAAQREGWLALPESLRSAHIGRAAKLLGCDWETPGASVFLEFVRNGNRTNFENISFSRRARLAELVLGKCAEGRGRFLDDIMNGIWTICEESYWGVPAHVGAQKRGPGLPDVTEPTVDLFAAETGMLLAWTDYLLGAELDRISPLIRERIRHEVRRRVLDPCLERDDFWWMGFGGRTVNNWNPWISSNWLPVLIDVGVETYTARTFSSRRYEIWTMQSAFHNLPTINGVMQRDGREYRASDLIYKSDRNSASLSLEIDGAYPDEAAVASWKRTITLRRGKDVVIRERFALKEVKKAPELSLMSWRTPSLEAGGTIRLDLPEGAEAAASIAQEGADPRNAAPADSAFPDDDKIDADGMVGQGRENRGPAKGGIDPAGGTQYREKMTQGSSRPLFILYDESTFRAAVEPIGLEDPQLRSSWGNRIFRIILTAKKTPLRGEFLIRVTDKL